MSEIQHKLAKLKPFADFYLSDSNHGGELLRGLNDLRKTKTFCNVFLKTRTEHQGFAVHREVLVAFSPYFKELCEDDSTTGKFQDIVLQDLSPSVLVVIIDYLYTGVITITSENAQDIFNAAALLQLKILRTISESYLIKCINHQNCLQAMSLAQKRMSRQLLERALQCMGANFTKVVELKDFSSMEAKDLKAVISSDYLDINSEDEVYEAVRRWIENDREQRLKYIPLLMSQVRFRFLPREFLTTTHKQDSIMSVSPLSEDFVHEGLMYDTLSPEEQGRVHTARVLERWCSQSTEVLLLVGGVSPEPEHTINHWAFDPVTSQWHIISPLQSPRHLFGVVQCDSGLYVFGGLKNMTEDKFLTTVELYDAKLNKWKSVKKTMREARCRFDAVSVGEIVYFVGGMRNDPHQNTLEMYYPTLGVDQAENSVEQVKVSAPKLPRYDHCTTVFDGKIYFIGGYTRGHKALRDVECYDPDQNTWSDVAPLLVPRTGACAVTLDDYIVVIGGSSEKKPLSSCEIYDRNKNKWDYIAPMNEYRDHCTAACFNNKIYVFGGSYGRVVQNSVECYNFKTNKWRVISHLPAVKHGFKCVKSVVHRSLVEQIGFEEADSLPMVLLGLRSSYKEDLQACTAELVYGTTLCLPGQFFYPSSRDSTEPTSDLVCKLKQTMQSLKSTPTKSHTRPTYVSKNLDSCTHVFVRQDHVQKPLDMPYKGPYRVVRRSDKYFELDLDGRHDTVSLDRLKPAFIDSSYDNKEDPVSPNADPEQVDPEIADPEE